MKSPEGCRRRMRTGTRPLCEISFNGKHRNLDSKRVAFAGLRVCCGGLLAAAAAHPNPRLKGAFDGTGDACPPAVTVRLRAAFTLSKAGKLGAITDSTTACANAMAIALGARVLARFTGPVPDVLIALLAGIALTNTVRLQLAVRPGIRFVLNKVLRTAIILLGAGLTLASIVSLGAATLWLVLVCVCVAIGLGLLLARFARLPSAVGTLIGAGTAICGGTAILAIGPLIDATDEEIAYAVTTIFTFNIIALIVYPLLGHALHLSSVAFGSWAGTAVNDTSVVVATGYLYGKIAGATATVVKLTRTLLLLPLAFSLGTGYAARRGGRPPGPLSARTLSKIPWFVLGFAATVLLNSGGVFPPWLTHAMTQLAGFLIVVVLAAVGLNVDLVKIGRLGLRPLAVGLALALIMAIISLSLITMLRIG